MQLSNEKDPLGISQHSPGAKLDFGKNDLDLVLGEFAMALRGVGDVGTYGARKYSPKGWLKVPNGKDRYLSALLRHYFSYREGNECDEESGLNHLAHLAWNALAAYELECRRRKESLHSTLKQPESTFTEEPSPSTSAPVTQKEQPNAGDSSSIPLVAKLWLLRNKWKMLYSTSEDLR